MNNREPTLLERRLFGLMLAGFFGVLGLLARKGLDSAHLGWTLWGLGGLLAVVYYALPPLQRPLFRAWMALTSPLAWLISLLVMGAAYYLVFTPVGIVLRLRHYDPLRRRLEPSAATYWHRRSERRELLRYLRLF